MPQRLSNKVALITGAAHGIGAAVAKRLAADGAAVAITYVASADRAQELVHAIEAAGGRAFAIKADGTDPVAVTDAVGQIISSFGGLDILVNNADVFLSGSVEEFSLADFDKMCSVNIRAVFIASQAAMRQMGAGGRIINMGSVNGEHTLFPGVAIHSMTKAAILSLTRGMAIDLAPRNITVNAIAPGPIATDFNPDAGPFSDVLKSRIPLHRFGTVDEIAGLVSYLAGPESSFITGATLTIDGGLTA